MPHTLHASVAIIRGVGVAFDGFVWEVGDPGFLDVGFGVKRQLDEEEASIRKLEGGGGYSVDRRIPLQEVNEALDSEFVSEDFDTLGGLVLGQLGSPPRSATRLFSTDTSCAWTRWTAPASPK